MISCPCSGVHSSPPGLLFPSQLLQIMWVTLCLMQANFSSEQSGRGSETEGVRKLKQLCSELTSRPEAVKDLLAALQDEGADKISTYEFLSSGAVQELRAYLQGEEHTSCHDGPSSALFPCP